MKEFKELITLLYSNLSYLDNFTSLQKEVLDSEDIDSSIGYGSGPKEEQIEIWVNNCYIKLTKEQ